MARACAELPINPRSTFETQTSKVSSPPSSQEPPTSTPALEPWAEEPIASASPTPYLVPCVGNDQLESTESQTMSPEINVEPEDHTQPSSAPRSLRLGEAVEQFRHVPPINLTPKTEKCSTMKRPDNQTSLPWFRDPDSLGNHRTPWYKDSWHSLQRFIERLCPIPVAWYPLQPPPSTKVIAPVDIMYFDSVPAIGVFS